MANTCTTQYVFEGEGKQINALYSKIKEISNTKPECDDYKDWHCCPNWLGYLAENILGVDCGNISCDGDFHLQEIENCPYDDDKLILRLEVFSAWSPCNELFDKIAKKYECSLYWLAEELGNELFQSNDSECRYFVDDIICVDVDDHGTEYFSTQEDALKYVREVAHDETLDWEHVGEVEGIYIHELDYV